MAAAAQYPTIADMTSTTSDLRALPHLRAWRQAAQLTQLELASRAYVNRSTISRLERGTVGATLELVGQIADALGIDCCTLIERAPTDGEAVIPTTLVQMFERRTPQGGSELWFFAPILWHRLERALRRLSIDASDEAGSQAKRAEIAQAAGISAAYLTAISEGTEAAPYSLLQRLAALLNTSIGELIDWRGYTSHVIEDQ